MRVALGLSYEGGRYEGWQSQPSGNTVQDQLEQALSRFGDEPIRTLCAGRTDAGVHALMQVVHFDTTAERAENGWVRGPNSLLPPGIAVQWARHMSPEFHCRTHALGRRYAYVLLQSPVRPSIDAGRVGWVFHSLDQAAMETAAGQLIGEHDFSSFRAAQCQSHTPVKTLRRIQINRRGAYWRFDFEANAFLHHMVRNLMGCLIQVGQGLRPADSMTQVLAARDRRAAAPTFSPDGLYFLGPVYDARWGLPERTPAYDWLP
jgi:tRNA pseudouridine38-40 synthase